MIQWDEIIRSPKYAKWITYIVLGSIILVMSGFTSDITFLELNKVVIPTTLRWIFGILTGVIILWIRDNYI